MKLPRRLYDEMREHALTDAPRECCGLVVCDNNGDPVEVWRASNVSLDPCHSYKVDPDDQLWFMRKLAALGNHWLIGAVYHSHPTSRSAPSLADIRSPYPGVLHIIIGMGQGLSMQAWELGHLVRPVELEVV